MSADAHEIAQMVSIPEILQHLGWRLQVTGDQCV